MNSSTLHITNGDSTTQYLRKLKISGYFITWREMLCEGKTEVKVGSEDFWKSRYDFFKKSYKITKKQFIELTLKEYKNLCKQKQQEEIILWFEYDLFCQINMLGVISWLKRYRKNRTISLVCSGEIKGQKKMFGLSELSEKQIHQHYKNKITLSSDDIEYADYLWQLYCSNNPSQLQNAFKYQPSNSFKYISSTLLMHLQRFPSIKNGLNNIENNMLTFAAENNLETKELFVGKMLQNQQNYGYGDMQYFKKINDLKKLFHSLSPVKLNETGHKVQQQTLNFYANLRNDFSFLGGAKKYNFLYDNSTNKLLKITSL